MELQQIQAKNENSVDKSEKKVSKPFEQYVSLWKFYHPWSVECFLYEANSSYQSQDNLLRLKEEPIKGKYPKNLKIFEILWHWIHATNS